ncbi:MAG TPA: hypothetical protein VGP72_19340 [Planctomycetota bacterium]|jgi:hypothetical protein
MSAKTKLTSEKAASQPARPDHARRIGRKRRAKSPKRAREAGARLTIADLGWTVEDAANVRAKLASFAEDWDDPKMDAYNEDRGLRIPGCGLS